MLERRPLKRRSIFFVVWLLLYIAFLIGTAILVFVGFINRPKELEDFLLLGLGLCYVVNVMSALAIWHWWKWGFFVLAASIIATVGLTVVEGSTSVWTLAGLLAGYIVVVIARPSWYYFE